jgi:hypothetical protein
MPTSTASASVGSRPAQPREHLLGVAIGGEDRVEDVLDPAGPKNEGEALE